jgi:hypothetical protein
MKVKFNIPLLYQTVHDEETKEIAKQVGSRQWSSFVRKSIVAFAENKGFNRPNEKPAYVPINKWQRLQELEKKQRVVDYSYVVAYHWLKTLPSYLLVMKSEVIREAIKFHFNINGIPIKCQDNHSAK